MGPREQIERAMELLDEDEAAGRISYDEHLIQMRELQQEYREAAAEDVRKYERDNWY